MPNRSRRRGRLEQRLRRGHEARQEFVSSHVAKAIAFQIRAMRGREGWSQTELARRCGTSQNAISRLESPRYGKPSLTTLKKIAGVFDVALIVRYAKFSELTDWVVNLNSETVLVPSFDQEELRPHWGAGDAPHFAISTPVMPKQDRRKLTQVTLEQVMIQTNLRGDPITPTGL